MILSHYQFQFYKKLALRLGTFALPILLSNILSAIVQITNQMMVSYLGETDFVAIGIANNLYFLFMVFLLSFPSGTLILMSRASSKNNQAESSRILLISMITVLLFSGFIMIVNFLFQDQFLSFILKDFKIDHIAANYNFWIILSYPFVGLAGIMIMTMRVFKLAYFVMFLTGMLVIVNFILNYLFIFGFYSWIPPMGSEGSGIATLISRVFYFLTAFFYLFYKRRFLFNHLFEFKILHLKNIAFFMKLCLSMGFADFTFAISIMFASKIFGLVNLNTIAAFNLISVSRSISIVPFIALGQANLFYISRKIAKKFPIARLFFYGKSLFKINFLLAMIEALCIFLFIPPLFNLFFHIEPKSYAIFYQFVIVFSLIWIFIPSNSFYSLMYRAGGNTRTSIIMNFTFDGIVSISLALLAYLLHFEAWLMLFSFFIGTIFKFIFYSILFHKKTWLLHKNTHHQSFSFGNSS